MLLMPDLVDELTSADLDRVKSDLLHRLRAVVPSQEHVLAHWDDLDEIERAKLATQIDEVDFDLLLTDEPRPQMRRASEDSLQPPPVIALEEQASRREAFLGAEKVGAEKVSGTKYRRLGINGS